MKKSYFNLFAGIFISVATFATLLIVFPVARQQLTSFVLPHFVSAATYDPYAFTYTVGSTGRDTGTSVITDDAGNIYYTGIFDDTVDFDPTAGTDNHTSSGGSDGFITKINADGSYGFTYTLGGLEDDRLDSVKVDNTGNIYLAGAFQGTADLDPTKGVDNHTARGGYDILLIKINADGSYGYAYTFGDTENYDFATAVTTDDAGVVYLTGYFESTVDFDPTAGIDKYTSNGSVDVFITKINADGSYNSTQTFGGVAADGSYGVTVDATGNIYLAGVFSDTVDFDPTAGTDSHASQGSQDVFLVKLNADGSYGYAYTVGGPSEDFSYGGIAVNSAGAIYLTGYFYGTVDFDPTAGTDSYTSASPGRDGFLTKINADGSYGSTAVLTTHKNSATGAFVYLRDVVVTASDDVYLTGHFYRGTVDFDPTEGVTAMRPENGGFDIFITKLNADGSYDYNYVLGGSADDQVNEIAVDAAGNIYFVGFYQSTADFNPTIEVDAHTSNGGTDSFLTKLGDPLPPPPETVQICHSDSDTTGPWSFLEVNVGSEHDGHVFDIIPITDLNGDGQINITDCGYTPPPESSITYLNQTVLKGSGLTLYYIEGGKKRAFSSGRVFNTWAKFADMHVVSDTTIAAISKSNTMNFRDGTLIRGSTTPTVYVVEDGVKRPFKSSSVFRALGYTFSRVLVVSAKELDLHSNGPAITNADVIPNQTLVKGTGPTVYYIDNGKKRAFSSGNIFRTWGTTSDINIISDTFLEGIPGDSVMGFRSGTLIRAKGTPTVYYIEDNLRRAFVNKCTFDELGFKTSNIRIASGADILQNTSTAVLNTCSSV